MFKSVICFLLILLSLPVFAQNNPSFLYVDNTRKIEVTGSAEMELIPDEIYYSISLQEYKSDNKKKVEIETLEKQFYKAALEAGIAKENIQIENAQGYKPYWDKRRKNEDFMVSKQYVLKLNNLYKINEIISGIDSKGIANTNISRYSHSKIEQYRKEVKIKALQAAKEKASYLLSSINEELGEVLQVAELENEPYTPQMQFSNIAMAKSDIASPQIDFNNINLRYEVKAVFKIK